MQRRQFVQAGLAAAIAAPGFGARAQGVGATEIVIGQTGILGGPLGAPVVTMLKGAGLAFDAVNAQGGVAGRKLRLVSLDDELKPDKAVANYKKLLEEENAFCFFGCVGSGTTAAAAPLLKASGAAMVGGYAVADSAREKAAGAIYMVRATTGREAQALVQHFTTIGMSRIGMAHLDNPGGAEALALLAAALKAHKLEPVAAAAVKGDGSNIAQAAAALAEKQPQAMVMYLGGALGGELMKAMWEAKSSPAFFGMSIVPGELTAKVLGERTRGLAISQVVPYPWGEVDPTTKEYTRLAAEAKVPVGYYSFEGYLNALVLLDALKRVGRDLTRPRLHAAMKALKLRLAGMEVDFTRGGHTGSRFIELVQVTREGRFVR